jgi:hypothetical protein
MSINRTGFYMFTGIISILLVIGGILLHTYGLGAILLISLGVIGIILVEIELYLGTNLEELRPATLPSSVGAKYCRYCGAENKNDATYCEKCGKNIA